MSPEDDVHRLQEHLDATEELPVRPDASTVLGEAAAIAADIADAELPQSVVVERVQRVATLLGEIETTGNPTADDHIDAAKRFAERITTDDE